MFCPVPPPPQRKKNTGEVGRDWQRQASGEAIAGTLDEHPEILQYSRAGEPDDEAWHVIYTCNLHHRMQMTLQSTRRTKRYGMLSIESTNEPGQATPHRTLNASLICLSKSVSTLHLRIIVTNSAKLISPFPSKSTLRVSQNRREVRHTPKEQTQPNMRHAESITKSPVRMIAGKLPTVISTIFAAGSYPRTGCTKANVHPKTDIYTDSHLIHSHSC